MSFGERIKYRRGELKLSRADLAERLGVSSSAVSNYENGVSFPKEDIMLRLFDSLETEPTILFQDSYRGGGQVMSGPEQALLRQYRGLSPMGRESVRSVVEALCSATAEQDQDGTAIVFMGHGTEHEANASYAKLQDAFNAAGKTNYLVGTVEAAPSLDDMLSAVQAGGYTKVVLQPLMVVAGDHANNDMAGDEPDSWKSTFAAAGYEVEPVLQGMGEIADIQQIYVDHVQQAIDTLN